MTALRFAMYDSNYVHSGYTFDSTQQLQWHTWSDLHFPMTRTDTVFVDAAMPAPQFIVYKYDTLKKSSSSAYDFNGSAQHASPHSSQTFVKFRGDTVIINHLINGMQNQSQQAWVRGLTQP